MSSETEQVAEMREDERERRDLRAQHARVSAPGDGLIRKALGDTRLRASEPVPDLLVLFGDHRDKQLVDAFGATISIVRRQLRHELAEELAERDPQLKKIAELELKVAELTGAVDVLRGKEPPLPARFPKVKIWVENTIYYEGDVVAFAGATYQARRDTAQMPGTADWACLAAAGSSLNIRNTYSSAETYKHLDVVMINGSSFVALKDNPGRCPDSGNWHLLASRGSRGQRGAEGARGVTGLRGERGEAAPVIRAWKIDRARYTATPIMSDSSMGPPLELHGLFEQFLQEVGNG
jgi:hypothetical protein